MTPLDVGSPVEDLETEMPRGAEEDAIRAIDEPTFGDGAWLEPDDEVIGIEVDGEARAYPVRVLDYHEIVNDAVDGRPVTVTFCPLCGSGLAFDRRVDERVLTFAVSGRLYRNDLVMFDRETESLWPQILGEALHGPLEGARLERLGAQHTTWGAWRSRYPDTLALEPPGIYPRSTYASRSHPGYEAEEGALFDRHVVDDRLHPKRWVVGLKVEDQAAAIPLDQLEAAGSLSVDVGGTEVQLSHEGGLVRARTSEGRRLDPLTCYWFAWVEFHPGTRLVDPGSG